MTSKVKSKRRRKLAKGIYEDKSGIAIRISVNGTPVEYRRETDDDDGTRGRPYKGRTVDWLKHERLKRLLDATELETKRREARETFAVDVETFLDTLSGDEHRLNVAGYMKHWTRVFGARSRNAITPVDVQTAFASIDKKPSTRRHIRRALVKFYEAMNGVTGYNPARAIAAPPKPQTEARAIPYRVIEKIFKALTASKARARLKLIAYIGLPQAQIAKLQPSDLRLSEKQVIVHPRRKGAGTEGRALPLSQAGVEALREFQQLDAFGTFQTQQLVDTFRLGAKKAGVDLPANARPYDLRHSFLTEVYRQTGDLYAVSELGIHATLEQTARYAKGAASERATKAIASVPRFFTTARTGKAPKRPISVHRNAGATTRKKAKK